MKKILPLFLGVILLFIASSLFLINNKTSKAQYSQTTRDHYSTTPSPENKNFNTYKNDKYNFSINYPLKSLDPGGSVISCGGFIKDNDATMFPPDETVVLDNIATVRILSWDKSINQYIKSQSAEDLYNLEKIMNSGADEAIAVNGLKSAWAGPGYSPMGYVLDLYKKDGKLFLVMAHQNFLNAGCINPEDISGNFQGVDKTWRIEDHFRFY